MRKLTSHATFGLTVLLAIFLAFTVLLGLIGYAAIQLQQQPANRDHAVQIEFAKSSVSVKIAPIVNLPPLPADPVRAVAAAPAAQSTPASTDTDQSNPNVFAADMTAAGISEADQPIVQTLLLDGPMWKGVGPMGVQVSHQGSSAVERFQRVAEYVVSRYGTWSAALAQSQNNQGNW